MSQAYTTRPSVILGLNKLDDWLAFQVDLAVALLMIETKASGAGASARSRLENYRGPLGQIDRANLPKVKIPANGIW